jgi:hypothetical protein
MTGWSLGAVLVLICILGFATTAASQQSRCADCRFSRSEAAGASNILNSAKNPSSPVNRRNLPTTCGTCHAGPFVAFQKSQHFALLEKGDNRVPVCSPCHGDAGYRRPSARALET